MLKIESLTFAYPRKSRPVIDGLSLDIAPGYVYGLLGSNGVGKSTLLYLIAGLLTPKAGHVTYNGVDTRLRLPHSLADIFIVPEEIALPALTVDSYVKTNAPFYPNFSAADFDRHLLAFDMAGLRSTKLTSLSMGQRKKVIISFALACNTSLLLMDEPTNGLDIPGKATFRKIIASTASDEKTFIISTHQARDIDRILDHVIIIDEQSLLLDQPITAITERLAFMTTSDPDLISRAYISMPAVGGAQIVVPNDGSIDTEPDLETLFQLAVSRRDIIDPIFNNSNGHNQ